MRGSIRRSVCIAAAVGAALGTQVWAVPTVLNVRAQQIQGTRLVRVVYDMPRADGPAATVWINVSTNGGLSYDVPAGACSGSGFGWGVVPGGDQTIVWDAGTDWINAYSTQLCLRVVADDTIPPADMSLVPPGAFAMGNTFEDEGTWTRTWPFTRQPVHSVFVSAFYIEHCETSIGRVRDTLQWGLDHGHVAVAEDIVWFQTASNLYEMFMLSESDVFLSNATFVAAAGREDYPFDRMTWEGAAYYCNLRSLMQGRDRCYDDETLACDWTKNGFRLPTEAEWERAARGGAHGQRFPWGNTISHQEANYMGSTAGYPYDLSGINGYHPVWSAGPYPYTSPVGSFAPNRFGLYDMAGNVWEWVWDRAHAVYASMPYPAPRTDPYYENSPASDPRGPEGVEASDIRIVRGGSSLDNAGRAQVSYRYVYATYSAGFRMATRAQVATAMAESPPFVLDTRLPVVSGVSARQETGRTSVLIDYNVDSWPYRPRVSVSLEMVSSLNGGRVVPCRSVRGDVGPAVPAGAPLKSVEWDAVRDLPGWNDPFATIRVTADGASAVSAQFRLDTRVTTQAFFRVYANRNDSPDYEPGEELAGAEVYVGERDESGWIGTTGPDGVIRIDQPLVSGMQVFACKKLHVQPSARPGHRLAGLDAYTLSIDSDMPGVLYGSEDGYWDGTWTPRVLLDSEINGLCAGTTGLLQLAHAVFEWDLWVCAATNPPLFGEQLRTGIENASDYLYDVTDGQMKFGRVLIEHVPVPGGGHWTEADLLVHPEPEYRPCANVDGFHSTDDLHMYFGNVWAGHGPSGRNYFSSIVHEFGHYALGFYDEYLNGAGNQVEWQAYRKANPNEAPRNYGLMDYQYTASEMSHWKDYLLPGSYTYAGRWQMTKQLYENSVPCWQQLKDRFAKEYAGVRVNIIAPPNGSFPSAYRYERPGPTTIPLPYAACDFISAPGVPGLAGASRSQTAAEQPEALLASVTVAVTQNGSPVPGARVSLRSSTTGQSCPVGVTGRDGLLPVTATHVGDEIWAGRNGMARSVKVAPGTSGDRLPIELPAGLPAAGSATVSQSQTSLVVGVWAEPGSNANRTITFHLDAGRALLTPPVVTAHVLGGDAGVPVPMTHTVANRYAGTLDVGAGREGTVEISCQAADGESWSTWDGFTLSRLTATAGCIAVSRDGWSDIAVGRDAVLHDTLAVLYQSHGSIASPDGPPRSQVGPAVSLAFGADCGYAGTGITVNLHYRDVDVVGVDETGLQCFLWDPLSATWTAVEGALDSQANTLSVTVTNTGVCALFGPPSSDATPPGTITNLTAAPGTAQSEVSLTWTDTGDDGDTGAATAYDLRFSTTLVTGLQWEACTALRVTPLPETAGTVRETTVVLPQPGAVYYFAMRAVDEAGNAGPFSPGVSSAAMAKDTDGDGVPDSWEYTYATGDLSPEAATQDIDLDGLTDLEEYQRGTNPRTWDTDGDGMLDGWEARHNLNPCSPADRDGDLDGDGLSNVTEYAWRTAPDNADTDGDGMPDGWETQNGLYPLSGQGANGSTDDNDGDGVANGAEFGADTRPGDSNSYLRITRAGPAWLEWQGGVWATQQLWRATTLTPPDWEPVRTYNPPTPRTQVDADPSTNGVRFYRIEATR